MPILGLHLLKQLSPFYCRIKLFRDFLGRDHCLRELISVCSASQLHNIQIVSDSLVFCVANRPRYSQSLKANKGKENGTSQILDQHRLDSGLEIVMPYLSAIHEILTLLERILNGVAPK